MNTHAKNQKSLNIIFIGNSITQGACLQKPNEQAPPTIASNYIAKRSYQVQFENCGYNGSTTVDFLPISNNLFRRVIHVADSLSRFNGELIFSITLGTNDSAIKGPKGSPVKPENYNGNILTIIDSLKHRYPTSIFVLNRPIWYSENTYNRAMYLSEGLNRLNTYFPEIKDIVRKRFTFVAIGDTVGYQIFKSNYMRFLTPEKGNAGIFYLHPNKTGAHQLGILWAKAILQAIKKVNYNELEQ